MGSGLGRVVLAIGRACGRPWQVVTSPLVGSEAHGLLSLLWTGSRVFVPKRGAVCASAGVHALVAALA